MKKTTTLLFFCCATVLSCLQINAQQIYTNGPLSTGAVLSTSTPAPLGYTWSEIQSPNNTLGSAGIYNTAMSTDFSLADDFTVPVGETWNLSSVDFFGYQTNYAGATIPIDAIRVQIWNGNPSIASSAVVFGNLTVNVLNATNSGNAFMYRTGATAGTTRNIWKFNANTTVSLTAGTYWIEMQVHATNDSSIFFPPVTVVNSPSNATWNAIQRNVTWATLTDAASGNTVALPFNLNGSVLSNENFEFSSKVSLYPNPASNVITLVDGFKSNSGTVQIYDVTGRLVKSVETSLNNETTIEVSELQSGNYILKLKSENGIAVKKFVKL